MSSKPPTTSYVFKTINDIKDKLSSNVIGCVLHLNSMEKLFPCLESLQKSRSAICWIEIVESRSSDQTSTSQFRDCLESFFLTLNDDLDGDELIKTLGSKLSLTYKLFNSILSHGSCSAAYSADDRFHLLVMLTAFLTHNRMKFNDYLQDISNSIFSAFALHLETYLVIMISKIENMVTSRKLVTGSELIPIVCLSQIFLPFVDLICLIIDKFRNFTTLNTAVNATLEKIPLILKKWHEIASSFVDGLDETSSVLFCLKHYRKIATGLNLKLPDFALRLLNVPDEKIEKRKGDTNDNVQYAWRGPSVEYAPEGYQDIRNISLLPSMKEIIEEELFHASLPGNHLFDKHAHWMPPSAERLIDTHFRLLREDMHSIIRPPLRTVISSLSRYPDGSGIKEGRMNGENMKAVIHRRFRIEAIEISKKYGIEVGIAFDKVQRSSSMNKNLASGMIALLEIGGENANFYFANIRGSVKKEKEIIVTLQFIDCNFPAEVLFESKKKNLILIEYLDILFDAYSGILQSLKHKFDVRIPFENVLFPSVPYLEEMNIDSPAYTRHPSFSFNLSFLSPDLCSCRLNTQSTASFNQIRDTLAHSSTLDENQALALTGALSSNFACIMGPPGTGKTFIGLQIVRALLNSNAPKPILVVAYTNHALDQFMELLYKNGAQRMVRIGGRSLSKIVQQFELRNLHINWDPWNFAPNYWSDIIHLQTELPYLKELCETQVDENDILDEMKKFPFFDSTGSDDQWTMVGKNNKALSKLEKWKRSGCGRTEMRPTSFLLEDDSSNSWSYEERMAVTFLIAAEIKKRRYDEFTKSLRNLQNLLKKVDDMFDQKIADHIRNIRKIEVVGITTTGAGLRESLITKLKAEIVIVEEASEIVESHILSLLNSKVQHVISIGDHKQLRPHLAQHFLSMENSIGKKYCLDMSQFERLQQSYYKFPLQRLNIQRRMCPNISRLVRETIYPDLLDHLSVMNPPKILGMHQNSYFFTHNNAESSRTNLSGSFSNEFEAEFAIKLCQYLIQNGYHPSKITILTPYLGQLFLLRKKMSGIYHIELDERDEKALLLLEEEEETELSSCPIVNVQNKQLINTLRISTVDNYQGEENDIIIVSLVRNEGENRIYGSVGFLKITNRTNVLLSRAKYGMYLLGQKSLLAKNSPMWAKVIEIMDSDGLVGPSLPIYCQKHPDYRNEVETPEMFQILAPNGGCSRRCEIKLPECGHRCPRACHSDQPSHHGIVCNQICQRLHDDCKHPCEKQCSEPCGKCFVDRGNFTLECGHEYKNIACYLYQDPSQVRCEVEVQRVMPGCGHLSAMKCHEDIDVCPCRVKCMAWLQCGHTCEGTCSDCHLAEKEVKHVPCSSKCNKLLNCGHMCSSICHFGFPCPPCSNVCTLHVCVHSKCAHKCSQLCMPCVEKCRWSCPHYGKCPLPCSAPCLRVPCDKRCTKILDCGHQCPSLCGEKCPDKRFCQSCTDMGQFNVDLILFQYYSKIDLDLSPIIVLNCGHFFTVETCDGMFDLEKFYHKDKNGEWIVDYVQQTEIPKPPTCPQCRAKVSNIFRYGRAIKEAAIVATEKLYLQNLAKLKKECAALYDNFEEEDIMNSMLSQLLSAARNPVSMRVYDACIATQNEMNVDFMKLYPAPRPQYRFLGDAYLLYAKMRIHRDSMFSHFRIQRFVPSVQMKFLEQTIDALKLASEAFSHTSCLFEKHETQYHFFLLLKEALYHARNGSDKKRCDRRKLAKLIGVKVKSLEENGIGVARDMLESINRWFQESSTCISFKEKYEVLIRKNLIEPISSCTRSLDPLGNLDILEIKIAIDAMHFNGSHWYQCPNGHLYVIGECGRAMELSVCPECGYEIGGQNHLLNTENRSASDVVSRLQNLEM